MTPDEIRAAMARHGLSVRGLAASVGMNENYLTKSLGGARRFQVDEMDAIRRLLAERDADEGGGDPIRSVPLLGDVPAGRFDWREQQTGRQVAVDRETPRRAYALKVKGDSMDLVAPEGTTLIIDPDDVELWPGRKYIVRTQDGRTNFKEFQPDPARLVPCSSNDEHRDILLGSEPIDILGRVFSYITRDMPRRSKP
ncbi:MAG TPA: S24 family peptidase [Allosphingosinicella sp.]|jgi:SOS-response transcriptional repressor LexA